MRHWAANLCFHRIGFSLDVCIDWRIRDDMAWEAQQGFGPWT